MRIARPWSRVQGLEARSYSTPLAQVRGLLLVVEALDGDDRAEDLLLDHLVVLLQATDHGGLVEEVAAVEPAAAGGDLGVAMGAL
jgi:hypothetical protein